MGTPPPSWRKLLLLSICAFVACSAVSTSSIVSSGQPNRQSTMRPKTVPNEERFWAFPISIIETAKKLASLSAMRLYPFKGAYVDHLFRTKIDVTVQDLYNTPTFREVAESVIDMHLTWGGAMTSLFNGLLRAKKAAGILLDAKAFDDLVHQIVLFKGLPEQPSVGIESPKYKASADFNRLRRIMLGLGDRLLQYWKAEGYTPNKVHSMLKVDITSISFFEDPNVLLWIDFLAKYRTGRNGSPFDLVLEKFMKSMDEFEIATKLVAAGADTKPGYVAEQLREALFRHWTRESVQPLELLRRLVPSLEIGIFNGPLKLWIKYFTPSLQKKVFPTILQSLLLPDKVSALPSVTPVVFPRNRAKEMKLAEIIAAELSKDLNEPLDAAKDTVPSPLTEPMARALSAHWIGHGLSPVSVMDVVGLFRLKLSPTMRKARQRVVLMYWVYNIATTKLKGQTTLGQIELSSEAEQFTARVVDWNDHVYGVLSSELFKQWSILERTKDDVFNRLELSFSDKKSLQNPLLILWYHYTPKAKLNQVDQLVSMRLKMMETYTGSQFELDLEEAVKSSSGELQRILFDLLAIRWIKNGTPAKSIQFLDGLNSSTMRTRFEKLQRLASKKVRSKKKA